MCGCLPVVKELTNPVLSCFVPTSSVQSHLLSPVSHSCHRGIYIYSYMYTCVSYGSVVPVYCLVSMFMFRYSWVDELHPIQISWNICCVHTLACATDCNRGYGLQKVLSESCWLRARGVGGHELYYVMDYKSASAATTFLLIGGSIMWALIVVIFVAESYLFLCGDLK